MMHAPTRGTRPLPRSLVRCALIATLTWYAALPPALAGASLLCAHRQSGIVRLRESCKRGENPLPISIEDGGRTIRVTGVNVQIVNGQGETGSAPNGVGNLIIGYDEQSDPPKPRTGSHNLVVGQGHGYSSYAGLVAGDGNTLSGPHASVTGGRQNVASGEGAVVCGGTANRAEGIASSIAGGRANAATALDSSVSGGSNNEAVASTAWVGGGRLNAARGAASAVSGGWLNEAIGNNSSVNGGFAGAASGANATVGGGLGVGAPNDNDWAAGSLYQPGS